MAETDWIKESIAVNRKRKSERDGDRQWQMYSDNKKVSAFDAEFRRLSNTLQRDTERINQELPGGGNTFQFNPKSLGGVEVRKSLFPSFVLSVVPSVVPDSAVLVPVVNVSWSTKQGHGEDSKILETILSLDLDDKGYFYWVLNGAVMDVESVSRQLLEPGLDKL